LVPREHCWCCPGTIQSHLLSSLRGSRLSLKRIFRVNPTVVGRVAQSVQRLTPGWTARRFFAHVQTGPGAHPASCTMGTGSFAGVNWPGRGADHPPPPSAEVENE
jgi:hypothetical protein